jgi:hypothetical protein
VDPVTYERSGDRKIAQSPRRSVEFDE